MSSQAVKSDQAYPLIDGIQACGGAPLLQVIFERRNATQSFGVIKSQQVLGRIGWIIEPDFAKAGLDLVQRWRREPWACHYRAERVDVIAEGHTAQKGRFERSSASAHERIIYFVAGYGKPLDEEAWQLRFEASAVR